MPLLSESRSIYSGPIRRGLERGERLGLQNTNLIKGLDATVGGIGTQVGGIEDDVGTLQSQVTTLQSSVSTLTSQVGTLQGQVSTLQTQVGGLQTQITNQTAAIDQRALGCIGYRGLSFSGVVDVTVGLNVSGTLGPFNLVGHRYKITLHLHGTYNGASYVVLYLNGASTGRGVYLSGGGDWGSAIAEWVYDLSGSTYFDAVVTAIQGAPKIGSDAASFFEVSDMGPAR